MMMKVPIEALLQHPIATIGILLAAAGVILAVGLALRLVGPVSLETTHPIEIPALKLRIGHSQLTGGGTNEATHSHMGARTIRQSHLASAPQRENQSREHWPGKVEKW